MELKSRYQYTYFIHTYIIEQGKYNKYIAKLLKDQNFNLKIFRKVKDLELYTYFLPNIRSFLFKTFELNKSKIDKLEELPFETKVAVLADYPCLTFEYDLKKDMQGKTIDENSIFFKFQKIGVICFNTGICFLYFKTNIEESNRFADVLNFNYKFKDINQEYEVLKKYENIKVQADCFDNMKEIRDFISEITGPNFDALKLNLDVERFYTFGYECIDQSNWSSEQDFENIKDEFLKYINIISNDKVVKLSENRNIRVISEEAYSKIGISKMGVNLFSSDVDINNYTVLPHQYENQYFYTYILTLYLKIYLKKINYEFVKNKNIKKARQDFVDFTKKIWIQEITSEDFGSLFYNNLINVLEIENLYNQVKSKYDILYRELKIDKTEKLSIFIATTLVVTLVLNILNWLNLL